MARLISQTFLTLDGVSQGPGGPDEDTSGGFDLGGWVWPYFDEAAGDQVATWFKEADAFLLGRRTYDIFAAYWPHHVEPGDPVSEGLERLPKYVASHTLTHPEWAGTTVLDGDVPHRVAELKERYPHEVQIHGSLQLTGFLLRHRLVDEMRLLYFPVVLGRGRRLFEGATAPTAYQLADHQVTPSGINLVTYRLEGEPRFGTVGE
ncbi:dihydrofolate reductase family protein [Streptomyces sp. NPDC005438]|uniref:dihydrofolate reductase family protein n=1 Tax=Streptomyces sp. NPDC005438 TaxID=3156880 RepID=UPI0033B74E70